MTGEAPKCEDCSWEIVRGRMIAPLRCVHPTALLGHNDKTGVVASFARLSARERRKLIGRSNNDWCGPEAKHFEPKS